MRRREFIAGLGSAAALPVVVRAQQPTMFVVGYLDLNFPNPNSPIANALRRGLAESGFVEGRNIKFEFRWADTNSARLPELAADLVRRKPAVIVARGSPASVLAAEAATSTIPIIFETGFDPVKWKLVASLNRPGGNATGISILTSELAGKQLNLLLDMLPKTTTTVAYLAGPPGAPIYGDLKSAMLSAAQGLGREMIVLSAAGVSDVEAAFSTITERSASALIVGSFTSLSQPRIRQGIIELATRHKIPTIGPNRGFAVSGGLMSYSADAIAVYQQLGKDYVGKVLKGVKPADLPVQQPTKFELVINLKTAKALGITIPETLLATADEVIQ
jgi:putative tryptophan/tyrosine transport system substrate-binding protein